MRSVSVVGALYALGLVCILGTSRRELLRKALYSADLLLPPVSDAACQRLVPWARGRKLHAGSAIWSCVGCQDPSTCQTQFLKMHDDGSLAIYDGTDDTATVVWTWSVKRWFWQKPVTSPDYWAVVGDRALKIGRGTKTVRARPLYRCGSLLERLVVFDTVP